MLWWSKGAAKAHKQYAALPYVPLRGGVAVCLITTRGRGRLIIPKGWPKPGLKPHELAAREAYEEAGLAGEVSPEPLGSWRYTKRLHVFARIACEVEVFPLLVQQQAVNWPEKGARRLIWTGPAEAADMIDDVDLARLMRAFGAKLRQDL